MQDLNSTINSNTPTDLPPGTPPLATPPVNGAVPVSDQNGASAGGAPSPLANDGVQDSFVASGDLDTVPQVPPVMNDTGSAQSSPVTPVTDPISQPSPVSTIPDAPLNSTVPGGMQPPIAQHEAPAPATPGSGVSQAAMPMDENVPSAASPVPAPETTTTMNQSTVTGVTPLAGTQPDNNPLPPAVPSLDNQPSPVDQTSGSGTTQIPQ